MLGSWIGQVAREELRHLPDEAAWHAYMSPLHDTLGAAAGSAAAPLRAVDPGAARQEFVANGQDGLDDLLAALDGGFEARPKPCHLNPDHGSVSWRPQSLDGSSECGLRGAPYTLYIV